MKSNFLIPLVISGFIIPAYSTANSDSPPNQNSPQSQQMNNATPPPSQNPSTPSGDNNSPPPASSQPANGNTNSVPSNGQAAPSQNDQNNTSTDQSDAQSLCIIHQINLNEIELSQKVLEWLAAENGKEVRVARKLANLIIKHHESIETDLKELNISPVSSQQCDAIKDKGLTLMKKLSTHHGRGLARQYIDDMASGHVEGATLVEGLLNKTSNEKVKPFLIKTLGLIQAHAAISDDDQNDVN